MYQLNSIKGSITELRGKDALKESSHKHEKDFNQIVRKSIDEKNEVERLDREQEQLSTKNDQKNEYRKLSKKDQAQKKAGKQKKDSFKKIKKQDRKKIHFKKLFPKKNQRPLIPAELLVNKLTIKASAIKKAQKKPKSLKFIDKARLGKMVIEKSKNRFAETNKITAKEGFKEDIIKKLIIDQKKVKFIKLKSSFKKNKGIDAYRYNKSTIFENQGFFSKNVSDKTVQRTFSSSQNFAQAIDKMTELIKIAQVNGEMHEMTINLKPDHLGKLTMKFWIEDGQVHGKLITDSHYVQEILKAEIADLKSEFLQNGMNLGSLDVAFQDGSRGNNSFGNEGELYEDLKLEAILDKTAQTAYIQPEYFGMDDGFSLIA